MNRNHADGVLQLSVVVPCHNPQRGYLARVMDALRGQTLPQTDWELVVVDNASDPPLSDWVDVSWHAGGRVVRETRLGLTPARLRGFSESHAPLIVMVDDDNLLATDYLEQAARIAQEKPFLGAFGGAVNPEYEVAPARKLRTYLTMLGVRDVPFSVWSNDQNHWASTPIGGGMCLRKEVAAVYERVLEEDALRQILDRQGTSLVSGGDIDLVFTGLSLGLGMGVFRELQLTHLIPAHRLEAAYLLRLSEGVGFSSVLLDHVWNRGGHTTDVVPGFTTLLRRGIVALLDNVRRRRFVAARHRGAARGMHYLRELRKQGRGGKV